MAKIFGFTPLELRPGVDEQEFIKFVSEQYIPILARLGSKNYILKADRGERAGKFAFIWEDQSVEQRNRYFPALDQPTEEALRLLGPEFDEAFQKLDTYVTGWPWTDYIEQGV